MYAARAGEIDVALVLLMNGANINGYGNLKHTALMEAATNGHIEMIKLLIERRAIINYCNFFGRTALIEAIEKGHEDIVRLLIKEGANVNVTDINGKSALMYAIEVNSLDAVLNLIKAGARIDLYNKDNETILQIAGKLEDKTIYNFLTQIQRYQRSVPPLQNIIARSFANQYSAQGRKMKEVLAEDREKVRDAIDPSHTLTEPVLNLVLDSIPNGMHGAFPTRSMLDCWVNRVKNEATEHKQPLLGK